MLAAAVFTGNSSAGTYDLSTIEYSVGEGNNTATIVVDFAPDSFFAFECKWDGTINGFESVNALDLHSSTSLDVTNIDYGSSGVYVNDLDYYLAEKIDYINDYDSPEETLGWGYYVSTDNLNWDAPAWGANYYELSDGDIISWVWTNSAPEGHPDGWGYQYRGPGEDPMSIPEVPEPATLALFAAGGVFIRFRKSK